MRTPRCYVTGLDAGVFTAEGQDWGRVRRLTAPAFSHGNLDALVGTITVRMHGAWAWANGSPGLGDYSPTGSSPRMDQ